MADLLFAGWRRWGAFISILIALGVPATLAAKAWHDANNNPVIKVKIAGYDPRDLLRGHYMRFRFAWNWDEGQPDAQACDSVACCLCLDNTQPVNPSASIMACDDAQPAACPIRVNGYYNGSDMFDIGLNRYYVPETRARELEGLLRDETDNFHMGLSLKPSGKVVLEKLYYNGQPVDDYLRSTDHSMQE